MPDSAATTLAEPARRRKSDFNASAYKATTEGPRNANAASQTARLEDLRGKADDWARYQRSVRAAKPRMHARLRGIRKGYWDEEAKRARAALRDLWTEIRKMEIAMLGAPRRVIGEPKAEAGNAMEIEEVKKAPEGRKDEKMEELVEGMKAL
ncbi:hypothetical protein MMC08_007906 [Hypocenomyce scalaris]|nr:hypothetical protein [Hypocenomyce scalaris]